MTSVEIRRVETNKKQYLALLLLADEQEDMIDRYLERGSMYVLEDDGVKAECVVTDEGGGVLELKNIAVEPDFQGKGYGKALVDFLRSQAGRYGVSAKRTMKSGVPAGHSAFWLIGVALISDVQERLRWTVPSVSAAPPQKWWPEDRSRGPIVAELGQ